jgi:hypothetical protein
MRKSKFTESQIVAILAEGESGLAVGDVCRKSWSKAAGGKLTLQCVTLIAFVL